MSTDTLLKCSVCFENEDSLSVYRINQYDGNNFCDLCLNEVLTEESPDLLNSINSDGVVIYEDIEKEEKYLDSIGVEYIIWREDDTEKITLEEYISDRRIDADNRPKELKEKIKNFDNSDNNINIHKPKDIFSFLEERVVRQEEAKKVLSVAFYNHYKNIIFKHTNRGDIGKSNILLIGPTGSGKTYMNTLLAGLMEVPFIHIDANSFTVAGYSGGDVEDILEKLYIKSDKNLQLAQKGIVLVDEIDKLASNTSQHDIKKKGVQEALLKLIEGGDFKVTIGGNNGPTIDFDTSGVLFILAGSFSGINKIVEKRLTNSASIGFTSKIGKDKLKVGEAYNKVNHDDLEEFGLIPELIGRISIIAPLNPLSKEDLIDIMKNKKNSLVDSYKSSLAYDDVELRITKGALESVAEYSIKKKTGARGLKQVFDRVLLDLMYEAPSKKEVGRTLARITKKDVDSEIQKMKE